LESKSFGQERKRTNATKAGYMLAQSRQGEDTDDFICKNRPKYNKFIQAVFFFLKPCYGSLVSLQDGLYPTF
jgi:hypothetical protein